MCGIYYTSLYLKYLTIKVYEVYIKSGFNNTFHYIFLIHRNLSNTNYTCVSIRN